MRFDSALKVIRFLREHLGERVTIQELCEGIDLSYQPTHFHVRELEHYGIIATEKRGPRVLCALSGSDAAAIWLALESERRWREQQEQNPELARRGLSLRQALVSSLRSQLLSLAVEVNVKEGEKTRVWPVVVDPSARQLAAEIGQRAGEPGGPTLEVKAGTPDDLLHWLEDPALRTTFTHDALPLYGRERYWELLLHALSAPPPTASASSGKPSWKRQPRVPPKETPPPPPPVPPPPLEPMRDFID